MVVGKEFTVNESDVSAKRPEKAKYNKRKIIIYSADATRVQHCHHLPPQNILRLSLC